MRVSTSFESGRIQVLEVSRRRLTVAVPPDIGSPRFRQWFAFDVEADPGSEIEVVLDNAGECTWADALGGDYRIYASEGAAWHRTDSKLSKDRLVVHHTLTRPRVRLAYYPPYPSSRFAPLRRQVQACGGSSETLGRTPAGRPIERLVLGNGTAKSVYVVAQQHPGESMAGWFVEGLVLALCEPGQAARALLERATISIVPRMNPDGAAIGNHRTTPAGVDLNRSWALDDAPTEVAVVRSSMQRNGVDLLIDVHGDERLPWVFGQAADVFRGQKPDITAAIARFERAMVGATPDYQTEHKYPYDPTGKPSLAFCANWAQDQFSCAALTLEMPFSDHRGRPDPRGFFPARARRLGARALLGIAAALDA